MHPSSHRALVTDLDVRIKYVSYDETAYTMDQDTR